MNEQPIILNLNIKLSIDRAAVIRLERLLEKWTVKESPTEGKAPEEKQRDPEFLGTLAGDNALDFRGMVGTITMPDYPMYQRRARKYSNSEYDKAEWSPRMQRYHDLAIDYRTGKLTLEGYRELRILDDELLLEHHKREEGVSPRDLDIWFADYKRNHQNE